MLDQANQYRSVAAIGQMEQAKLVRAVDSQRQLQEVLVDFWGNHFNIDMKKGPDRVLKVVDDRDVIRPHILGRFRDLLEASAKSPAMLFYLDNAHAAPSPTPSRSARRCTPRWSPDRMTQNGNGEIAPPVPEVGSKKGGINENYAREIMELHTLGVDGGYTQQDVQEVARCFTGWILDRQTGEFIFRPGRTTTARKSSSATAFRPSAACRTAKPSSTSSPPAPPPRTTSRCSFASVSSATIRPPRWSTASPASSPAPAATCARSPRPSSPAPNFSRPPITTTRSSRRSNSPSPPSAPPARPSCPRPPALRQARQHDGRRRHARPRKGADRLNHRPRQSLNYHILELGEPLFACTPPTGYSEISKSWVSPGALIERLNFALALTEQKVSDVNFNPQTIFTGIDLDNPEAVLDRGITVLLQGHVSDATKKVLEQTVVPAPDENKTVNPTKLIALIIGSPDFQRK